MGMSEELYHRTMNALLYLKEFVYWGDNADYNKEAEEDIDSLIDDFCAWWETDES